MTTVTKALIGREDLDIQDSTTTTFSRATSTGGTTSITSLGRHTFNTREYDVTQWGAVGNGTTDDTAAIQAAIDAAEAAGGGTIVFPPGYTFRVQPTAVNTPIFTLTSGNLTFIGYGSTIKVDMTSDLRPTTLTNETRYGWVFKATNYDGFTFLGITFDGNRDDATYDPRYGFFMGARVSNVAIRDCTFKNVNTGLGAIHGTAWDAVGAAGERIVNWRIENNYFEQSNAGIWITESQANIAIVNNHFRNMNLAPYDSNLGPAWTDTFYSASKTARVIRISGFGDTDAATHGEINGIDIRGNIIEGGAWSIELWNNTDDNPDKARHIVIADNVVWGTHGISVTHFSDVTVANNVVTRMTDAEVAAYAGRHYNSAGTNTAGMTVNTFGFGIEAGATYNIAITGNTLDGAYIEAGSGGSGSPTGIQIGGTATTHRMNAVVSGNQLRRWYVGILVDQIENSLIEGNRVEETRTTVYARWSDETTRVSASGFTWKNNVLRGNTLVADNTSHGTGGSTPTLAELTGDWVVDGNTFIGPTGTPVSGFTMLQLGGFASTYGGTVDVSNAIVTRNTFRRFDNRAISNTSDSTNALLRMTLDGNLFDTESGSPGTTTAAMRVTRPTSNYSPVFSFGRNTALRLAHPLLIVRGTAWVTATAYTVGQVRYETASGTLYVCAIAHTSGTFATDLGAGRWTALTETYDFGEWINDGTFTNLWKSEVGGGTITGGVPLVSFGPRRKAMHLRVNTGTGTGDPVLDVTGALPEYSVILGVRGEIQSTFTVSSGTTGFSLGTTTDADAWGAGFALTSGTGINPSNWTVAANSVITSTAQALRLTATGGADPYFTDGYVTLIIDYFPLKADVL